MSDRTVFLGTLIEDGYTELYTEDLMRMCEKFHEYYDGITDEETILADVMQAAVKMVGIVKARILSGVDVIIDYAEYDNYAVEARWSYAEQYQEMLQSFEENLTERGKENKEWQEKEKEEWPQKLADVAGAWLLAAAYDVAFGPIEYNRRKKAQQRLQAKR